MKLRTHARSENMTVDAEIDFSLDAGRDLGRREFKVPVDSDRVRSDIREITDYVVGELEKEFGRKFTVDDFEITNMREVFETIAFEEFLDKTN